MEDLYSNYFSSSSLDKLTRRQLEAAIFWLDARLEKESDRNKVVQYCVLKIDLINTLMLLDKSDSQNFIR